MNYLGRKYAPQADPRAVTEDQVTGMPEVLATAVRELVAEYEAKESPEALCARDADKLECMIQGIEYKAQGYENAQRWIDNSRRRLTTKSANELADAVLATESLDWPRSPWGDAELTSSDGSGTQPSVPRPGRPSNVATRTATRTSLR
ncbi:hypothetical protein QFZ66_004618 [Streptomyces sp. B4I13]|nr:hypothetical protein [Streptomyces sp. B4I13]